MKRLLVLTLVVFMVLGLFGGVAAASSPNWFIEGEWSGWSYRTENTFTLTVEHQDAYGSFTGNSLYDDGKTRVVYGTVSGDKIEFTHDGDTYVALMEGDITATTMEGTFTDVNNVTGKWKLSGEAINIADGSFPAAPAVANELLKDAGIRARYGNGPTGGNYIADVANHMDDNERFNGVSKYNKEAYKAQILAFLIGKGAGLLPDGQVLWLDAADFNNGTWTDKSDNDNHATSQGSPTISNINGLPAVELDGANDYFTFPNPSIESNSDYTIFTVAIFRGKSDDDDRASFIYTGHIGGQLLGVRATGEIFAQHAYMRDDHDSLTPKTSWGPMNDVTNTANIFTATYNNGSVRMYLNSVAGNLVNNVGFTSTGTWRIGCQANRRYLNGDIAEIIIYNSTLCDSERELVESYLLAKYNLQ